MLHLLLQTVNFFCYVCSKPQPVAYPRLFSLCNVPLSRLLFAIYYWAIHVDIEDVMKSGQMALDVKTIYEIWKKIQLVCMDINKVEMEQKGNKLRNQVEVATVRFGAFLIVAAMESATKRKRITAYSESISSASKMSDEDYVYRRFLSSWIEPKTLIITSEPRFVSYQRHGYPVKYIPKNEFVTSKNYELGRYLISNLQKLFKDVQTNLIDEATLHLILAELQWREKYGRDPSSAFANIVSHLATWEAGLSSGQFQNVEARVPKPVTIAPRPASTAPSSVRFVPSAYPTASTSRAPSVQETIYVDEYYYSTVVVKRKPKNTNTIQPNSVACHICKMSFDNVSITNHLLAHLEKSVILRRVKATQNGMVECRHCLRCLPKDAHDSHISLVRSGKVFVRFPNFATLAIL